MPDRYRRYATWFVMVAGGVIAWWLYRPVMPSDMREMSAFPDSLVRDSTQPPSLPTAGTADSLVALLAAPDSLLDRYVAREYGYEERGLVVYDVAPGWVLVSNADSTRVWIPRTAADSLFPLETLLPSRLNYLTASWDGDLYAEPTRESALVGSHGTYRVQGPDADETSARVLTTRRTASGLWLEVEVLSSSGCDGEDPTVRAKGWIPAWGRDRQPTAWFFSRGC